MEKTAKGRKDAKDDKSKDKTEEQILKSLEAHASAEEKLQELLKKHVECERENRRLKQDLKVQERQNDTVSRERENLQKELNRSLIIRNKFTEVAREQQKMIKSLKNESMLKLREEEERRKESQYQFQTSLNEIAQSLTKNNEENLKLRDYNIEMTKKLKYLAEQYQTREQQLEKLNEQVELESQIHQAKLSKVQVEAAMEREILTKEKQIAVEKLLQTQRLVKDLTEREQELKQQLNLYTAKYDEFQNSLQKSNSIFTTYKTELDKMSKNTRKLEKEALEWKRKWEKSNATLIELATEKQERDEHAIRCNKQVEQLQKLLRALQNERSHLYKCIRENNIECPPVPQLPPEPEPLKTQPLANVGEKDKMEMMSKNCAELKQTLANLQNQMKFLTHAESTGAGTSVSAALAQASGVSGSKTGQIKQQQEEALLKKRQKRQKQRATKLNKNTQEQQLPQQQQRDEHDQEENFNDTENVNEQPNGLTNGNEAAGNATPGCSLVNDSFNVNDNVENHVFKIENHADNLKGNKPAIEDEIIISDKTSNDGHECKENPIPEISPLTAAIEILELKSAFPVVDSTPTTIDSVNASVASNNAEATETN